MSVMNKFMNFLGLQEEEEMIEREQAYDSNEEPEQPAAADNNRKIKNNVVSLHSSQKTSKLILCEPRNYEEAQDIADHLRLRKATLVNLQRVRPEQAMRIVDFLSGTVYALNGVISKVGPNIFICTPDSVEVLGTITDMVNETP